jgi:hypothetical protein
MGYRYCMRVVKGEEGSAGPKIPIVTTDIFAFE